MKTILFTLIALILLPAHVGLPSPGQDFQKAMLRFDQGFIPAWIHVKEGDMVRAKRAIFYLEFQWQRAARAYAEHLPPSDEVRDALLQTGDWLADAYLAIDQNQAGYAKRSLEHALYELRMLRRAQDIDYYLDYWYATEESLIDIVDVLNDPQLQLLEWEDLLWKLQECQKSWETLRKLPFDGHLLDWDQERNATFQRQKKSIHQKMASLQRAIDTADQELAAQAAQSAYETFVGGLRMFGNFSEAQSYYAEQQKTQQPLKTRAL